MDIVLNGVPDATPSKVPDEVLRVPWKAADPPHHGPLAQFVGRARGGGRSGWSLASHSPIPRGAVAVAVL